jgi:hypothetical protein
MSRKIHKTKDDGTRKFEIVHFFGKDLSLHVDSMGIRKGDCTYLYGKCRSHMSNAEVFVIVIHYMAYGPPCTFNCVDCVLPICHLLILKKGGI